MKITKAIFSSSEEYSDFWNIQSRVFKEGLGIEPVCLLFGKKENTDANETYGKIIEMEFIPDLPKIIQITWAKFYYTKLEPETTWLIGDIDQIPLQKEWFIDNINELDDDYYVHLNASACCQPYNLPNDTWEKKGSFLTGGADLPAHYHVAKGYNFIKAYNLDESFFNQINYICSSRKYGGGARSGWKNFNEQFLWCAEEDFSSEQLWLKVSAGQIKYKGFFYNNKNNTNRIDRSGWHNNNYQYDVEKLFNKEIIDMHCMRGHGSNYENQTWWVDGKGFVNYRKNSYKMFEDQTLDVIKKSGIINLP